MFAHLNPQSADFGDICALSSPCLHQLTMQSSLFEPGLPVSVVIYVSRASYARVQATVGVGTVLIRDFCVAYTRGGGYLYPSSRQPPPRVSISMKQEEGGSGAGRGFVATATYTYTRLPLRPYSPLIESCGLVRWSCGWLVVVGLHLNPRSRGILPPPLLLQRPWARRLFE